MPARQVVRLLAWMPASSTWQRASRSTSAAEDTSYTSNVQVPSTYEKHQPLRATPSTAARPLQHIPCICLCFHLSASPGCELLQQVVRDRCGCTCRARAAMHMRVCMDIVMKLLGSRSRPPDRLPTPAAAQKCSSCYGRACICSAAHATANNLPLQSGRNEVHAHLNYICHVEQQFALALTTPLTAPELCAQPLDTHCFPTRMQQAFKWVIP